jgi:hypothetical protein
VIVENNVPIDRYNFGRQKSDEESEKILKYKYLTIEIQHVWNLKTNVIPVIIGAT